ncbi:MAG: hypothetical protein OFPII_43210 [Osedax symbiont Rs1]|nr:MAG: hypothetical protein OFPII_43210 [Osedax symbiont Rs1]
MTDLTVPEIARNLVQISTTIAETCLPDGRKLGKYYKAGDISGRKGNSLVVNLNTGQWSDFANGEHCGDLLNLIYYCLADEKMSDAVKIAKDFLKIDVNNFEISNKQTKFSSKNTVKNNDQFARIAWIIWQNAQKDLGEPARLYLKQRKLYVPEYYSKYLMRYVPDLLHPDGEKYPALIFRVTTENKKYMGLHRIFLTEDGNKICEDAKLSIGPINGGAIKFIQRQSRTLLLDEGAEDALSLCYLMKDYNVSVWALTGVKYIKELIIPDIYNRIIISTNNDHTADFIIESIAEKYGDSREVISHLPPKKYGDFNCMLLKEGQAAVIKYFQNILKKEKKWN